MKNKYLCFIATLLLLPAIGMAQMNIAPMATANHSGGGSPTYGYGPDKYNDGIIMPGVSNFGWVSASNASGLSAWIDFEWSSPQGLDKIIFYPDDAGTRTLVGAEIQYWNGASWVSHHTYSVPPAQMYTIQFSPVVTTKIRITNFVIAGAFPQNPSLNEIEIFFSKQGEDNAGVSSIISPSASCAGGYDVIVEVGNFGVNQINSLFVEWEHNGTSQTAKSITTLLDTIGGLYPSTTTVTLGTITLATGSVDSLKIWTSLPNNNTDTVTANDTASQTYSNILPTVNAYPYIEDFEGGQADWNIYGSNSSWVFGTPAKPVINSAASGINCFMNGGFNGDYNSSENSGVSSPCFDFSNLEGEPWVAMDIWWESEFSWDGAALQYSKDGGASWKTVGAMGDPYNWYNDNTISGNPGGQQEGWTGTFSNGSGGWVKAKHALPMSLVGERGVSFRVAFGSDGFVEEEGVAFDNFIVADYKAANLGPDRQSLCGEPSITLDPDVNYPGKIEWSNGDTINPTIAVSTPGMYTVQFTDSLLGLISGDTIELIDTDPPSIVFTKSIDTVSVFSQTTLDPNLSYDHDFLWTPTSATYPYLLVKGSDYGVGAHTFTLLVTDSVLCTDQAVAIVVFVDYTGVEETEKGSVVFYPNPVKEKVMIQLSNVNADQLNVYNMVGQKIDTKLIGNKSTVEVDMTNLESGMYLIEILSGDKRIVQQIVKE